MDLGGVVERTGGLLGMHAFDAAPQGAVSAPFSGEGGAIRSEAGDVYTPSERSGEASPDLPHAVRQQIDSRASSSCYCGHCSLCMASASEKMQDREVGSSSAEGRSGESDELRAEESDESEESGEGAPELSEEEEREVAALQQRDQEVRAHEQAHVAAGARNAQYEYQTGPDGRQYAVGGSADIEISAMSGDHDTKISEARKMRAAALAPADPSTQDLAVAARAARIELEAMAEKSEEERASLSANDEDSTAPFAVTGGAYGSNDPFDAPAMEQYFAVA